MAFQKTVDISKLSDEEIAKLQPGQWVSNGANNGYFDRGRFYGVKSSGTIVVAWNGNAKGRFRSYNKAIAQYAAA